MKKFKIENTGRDQWLVSHNEFPKFTCSFEDKRYNYKRSITGLSDPSGDAKQIQLLQKMEKWLEQYHREKRSG
ncbi:hypothetical protein [Flavobacterium johnsoniae]|jgi:hypothetical protein|uniref:hypothetical protein n=1 Tax=Flavobacterium johnsoniae TaxID=986 RepID=UPI003D960421